MAALQFDASTVQTDADRNLSVALDLARAGMFVFPCQASGPKRKSPCQGIMWRAVSTNDPHKVSELWRRHPGAVVGLDVGKSGFLVIDCDKHPSDGIAWFESRDDSPYPGADTPSGGRHLYFLNPEKRGNGRGSLPKKTECGIDMRGEGGYVIAPGSVFLDDGGEYVARGSIFDAGPLPDWFAEILSPPASARVIQFTVPAEPVSENRKAAYGQTAIEELCADLAGAPPGSRSDEANRIAFRAGQLVGGGCLTFSHAKAALETAALSWGIRPTDKALGPRGTIHRALMAGMKSPAGPDDSMPAVVIELGREPAPVQPRQSSELPCHLTRVPGLVGDIADWIVRTSIHPQPALAIGAALTVVGTAAGRHIAGPTRSGTHLYIVGLAPSGAGKDYPLRCIAEILAAADMRQHIGPSQFISMPAVINFLARSPLSVCAMDEFGSFLKRINSRKASGFEGAISGLLRTAWGASFAAMTTPEWAGKTSETIFSPALSIFGASTAREFYESLEGADVTNGVLNRFLVIETKQRPQEQEASRDPFPAALASRLSSIYTRGGPLNQLCQSQTRPHFETMTISPEAEAVRRALVAHVHAEGDREPSLEPFLARTAENAIRLATIRAIGQGLEHIEKDDMEWARDFALWSSHMLAEGAGLYIADSETQALSNAVKRAISERGGRIKRRDLLRALAHKYKTRDLEDAIKSLAESEHIVVEKTTPEGEHGGRPSYFYRLT